MATIKEIAEKAGVSTTTVSNVIHGKTKKVSPATIQKIEALIKEVGYVQKSIGFIEEYVQKQGYYLML